MAYSSIKPKPEPTGNLTVRIKDVDPAVVMRAYSHLVFQGLITPEEAQALLDTILEGDLEARIAA